MEPHVGFESGGACEQDGANVALDAGGRTVVDPLVSGQRRLDRELLAAFVAGKGFLACRSKARGRGHNAGRFAANQISYGSNSSEIFRLDWVNTKQF